MCSLSDTHKPKYDKRDYIFLKNINSLCRVSGFIKPDGADKKVLFCSLMQHLATRIRNKTALFEIAVNFNRIYLKNEFKSKFIFDVVCNGGQSL